MKFKKIKLFRMRIYYECHYKLFQVYKTTFLKKVIFHRLLKLTFEKKIIIHKKNGKLERQN